MYKKTCLKNGIKVITHEDSHLLSISLGVWVNRGSRDEEKNGISHFIEHMLFKGTEKRSAHDIAKEIDSVGGMLNAFTSREFTCLYTKVLNKDLPLGIDLLSDIYLHSLFSVEEISKERMVILQEINLVEDTPDDLIHDLFVQNLWKGHPLGYSILGTASDVSEVKREDLLACYEDFYLKPPILITAAGNLRHEEIVNMVENAFGSLSYKGAERRLSPPLASSTLCIDERELEQVHLCMGFPSLPQNHPDRYKVHLLNTIIGGGMSSRLFQEIREKRGLAYSIYSYLSSYIDAGALTIYAGTGEGSCSDVISIILDELYKFVEHKVDVEELKSAKEQLKGNILLGLESSDSKMVKLAKDEIYHNRYISPEEIMAEIDKVSSEDIQILARDMFREDRIAMVVLGRVEVSRLEGILPKQRLISFDK